MNQDWISNAKLFSPAHLLGAKEFMKFARDHGHVDEMLCPCSLCLNLIRHPQSVVHAHINTNRMSSTIHDGIVMGKTG